MLRKSLSLLRRDPITGSIFRASAPRCEALEARRLLTTYPYSVPTGHSIAYLQPKALGSTGQVQVRLDTATTGTVVHAFINTTGKDIIDCGPGRDHAAG